jgi:hypothetical protein
MNDIWSEFRNKLSEVRPAVRLGALVAFVCTTIGGALAWLGGGGALPWWLVLILAALCVAAVVSTLWLVLYLIDRNRSKGLKSRIDDGAQRGGPTDGRESKATVDHLRGKFRAGLDSQRGTDLVSKPWYLVMGHPGTGKTYAVAKSGIPFRDNLNEAVQGVGGTKTIDWWFARDAILVDTAGRYVEGARRGDREEQARRRGEASGQLKTLLALLKQSRPHRPINGLILVIAATDLLTEDDAERTSRAADLRSTLIEVQSALDVRFPVIVWITKCDKIPGFREYFRNVEGDDALSNQMFGWSNSSQDFNSSAAFDMGSLSDGFESIAARLRRRRWSLLRDLRLRDRESLADAASALFGFPEAWIGLAPRLEAYLRIVFAEPGDKAPYLRGVYFNSAVTEGDVLDAELAKAQGKTLKDVWTGELDEKEKLEREGRRIWTEERTYFIRDTLTKKLFCEVGLVSRYTDAVSALNRTYAKMIAAGVVVVASMALWAWTAKRNLEDEVLLESNRWELLARTYQSTESGSRQALRLVERLSPEPSATLAYRGQREFGDEPLLSFYRELGNGARRKIEPSILFRWVPSRKLEVARREGVWRRILEAHALQPLLSEAGVEIGKDWRTNGAMSAAALEALVLWEMAVGAPNPARAPGFLRVGASSRFGEPLLRLVTDRIAPSPDFKPSQVSRDGEIVDELAGHVLRGRSTEQLSQGSVLASNRPVASALRQLTQHTELSAGSATDRLSSMSKFAQTQSLMSEAMNRLGTAAIQLRPSPRFRAESDARSFTNLGNLFQDHGARLRECEEARRTVLKDVPEAGGSLSNALQILAQRADSAGFAEMIAISNRLASLGAAGSEAGPEGAGLAGEAMAEIQREASRLRQPLDGVVRKLAPEVQKADRDFLFKVAEGSETPAAYRHRFYRDTLRLFDRRRVEADDGLDVLRARSDELWSASTNWAGRAQALTVDRALVGAVSNLIRVALDYRKDRRLEFLTNRIGTALTDLGFPYRRTATQTMTVAEAKATRDTLLAGRKQMEELGTTNPDLVGHVGMSRLLLDDLGEPRTLRLRVYGQNRLPTAPAILSEEESRKLGSFYRHLKLGDAEEVDLVVSNADWSGPLSVDRLPMRMRTEGGSLTDVPEVPPATYAGDWGVLRWLAGLADRPGVEPARFALDSRTNCTIYLRVTDPGRNQPLAIGIALEGAGVEWKKWFESRPR